MAWTPYPRHPESGFIDSLSLSQRKALDLFRRSVKQLVPSPSAACSGDLHLLRFLRARQFDIEKATELFAAFLHFRVEHQLDAGWTPHSPRYMEARHQHYPCAWHGVDVYGRPIHIEKLGRVDVEALLTVGTLEKLKAQLVREYEDCLATKLPACSLKKGSLVEHTCNIIDLEGLWFPTLSRGVVRRTVLELIQIQQMYFPEVMGQGFVINVPGFFSVAWQLVSPVLGKNTTQKLKIFTTSESAECYAALREVIPEENLPTLLGGCCECKVKGGCIRGSKGPWNDPLILEELKRRPGWQVQADFAAKISEVAAATLRGTTRQTSASEEGGIAEAASETDDDARNSGADVEEEDAFALMQRLQYEAANAEMQLWRARVVEERLSAELDFVVLMDEQGCSSCMGSSRKGKVDDHEDLREAAKLARTQVEACEEVFRGKMHFYRLAKADVEEKLEAEEKAREASPAGGEEDVWKTPQTPEILPAQVDGSASADADLRGAHESTCATKACAGDAAEASAAAAPPFQSLGLAAGRGGGGRVQLQLQGDTADAATSEEAFSEALEEEEFGTPRRSRAPSELWHTPPAVEVVPSDYGSESSDSALEPGRTAAAPMPAASPLPAVPAASTKTSGEQVKKPPKMLPASERWKRLGQKS
eukprot:TRINITY_DN64630_c0_g1_i1.p1 TRINITY_DN64630_c0_g1~~TRINITY_DN64630_c0_g1_i1.p1  ORF type:complete len:649 (+),score=182.56 TRINITY_DN64630_c0_g1_i1:69-2015(+)